MSVFPIEQLNKMRPDWCRLHDAGLLALDIGEEQPPHFHDQGELLFVLQGRCHVRIGSRDHAVEEGEVVLIKIGEVHSISRVEEPTAILWARDDAQAPFRPGDIEPGDGPNPPMPPREPLTSPRRRGHTVIWEVDRTFSTAALKPGKGDIALRTSPGDLSQVQARDFREALRKNGQSLLLLMVEFLSEKEIPVYLADGYVRGNIERLRPLNLSIPLDPTKPEAARIVGLLREYWLPHLRLDGVTICLEFEMQRWSPAEQLAVMKLLGPLPPAHFGVSLVWDPARCDGGFGSRVMLGALFPWLRVVSWLGETGLEEQAHYLEGMGYQGWVVQR